MLSDLLIFKRVKSGDVRAFETLFKSYYKPLCIYAVRYVGELEVAEEIVQDVFYTVWKKKEELSITTSVKSYLYKAVLNKSLQYIEHLQVRNKYRDVLLALENDNASVNPSAVLEYGQLEEHIVKVIAELPERRRKIFSMSRFEGRKYSEIALSLSISVKTVEAEISKAIRTLKENIKNYVG